MADAAQPTRPQNGADGKPLEYASCCWLPTDWTDCPLVGVLPYNHNSKIYEFGLPDGASLNLPVCSCILTQPPSGEGARPYTPMSSNKMRGKFQLLIKRYPAVGDHPPGVVSNYIDGLSVGQTAKFKHIAFNIKEQFPFRKKKLTMICGGTGITPIYQALLKMAETPGDDHEAVVLYGNASVEDILMRKELDTLVEQFGGRVRVEHVVGTKPDQEPIEGWSGLLGWVDEAKVKKYAYPPGDDTLVMICGLPVLYTVMCGPRGEKELKEGTVLHKLGYTTDMIVKF